MAGIGVYPGSFDPLTVAHLAIAEAAVEQLGLERLDLVVSHVALAKEDAEQRPVEERVAAIEAAARDGRPWMRAYATRARLVADIADGYDVCVIGADKWHQIHDLSFYGGSVAERAGALARLPLLAVAPRNGCKPVPKDAGTVPLALAPRYREVSSSAVRAGRHDWRA
jgi:hypothetical protein